MRRDVDVSLGDIIRAYAGSLAPEDEHTRTVIATLLGFDRRPLKRKKASGDKAGKRHLDGNYRAAKERADRPSTQNRENSQASHEGRRLKPIAKETSTLRLTNWKRSPSLEPFDDSRHGSALLFHYSLFRREWTRAIVSEMLATACPCGDVDVSALVEQLARGKAVARAPRAMRPTLSRGVQLLIDIGEGMQPFERDCRQIRHDVATVTGKSKIRIWQYRDSPLSGIVPGSAWEWGSYKTPPMGTPVLVISDCGIGSSTIGTTESGVDDWMIFLEYVRRQQCPLIALVPYPRSRWPEALRLRMRVVQWDRRTTAGSVRYALGRVTRGTR